jgi:hypothetical protein
LIPAQFIQSLKEGARDLADAYTLHTAWYANLEELVQTVRFYFILRYYQYYQIVETPQAREMDGSYQSGGQSL